MGQLGQDLMSAQILSVNPDWRSLPLFNREGWTKVRFGDVVQNANETESTPAEAGLERFIGLEHLEPGSLHIRRWGNIADGTTFTRRCRPGQVLFGKRRAYQRKVAVAEFDAVVSGDIYVLAPNDDRLLKGLLPFICLSERFFQYAVGTSAGSLSPRTNWSSLASFEFALPPLNQQQRIVEILWKLDEALQAELDLLLAALNYKSSTLEDQFSGSHSTKLRLADLCGSKGIRIGPFGSQLHAHEYVNEGIPVVMPANLDTDEINLQDLKRITPEKAEELSVHRLEEGDVLLPRRGDLKKRGFVYPQQNGWICGTGTIRIRTEKSSNRRLLFYSLSRSSVSAWLERNSVGTTMPNLNSAIVSNIEAYWPKEPQKAQQAIDRIDSLIRELRSNLLKKEDILRITTSQFT